MRSLSYLYIIVAMCCTLTSSLVRMVPSIYLHQKRAFSSIRSSFYRTSRPSEPKVSYTDSVPVVDVVVIDRSSANKHSPPQLRDRQAEIVRQSVEISKQEKRALISAPTGYGKTAIFSSIITEIAASMVPAAKARKNSSSNAQKKLTKRIAKSHETALSLFKVVVLSPTIELNRQNEMKFKFWNDGSLCSLSTGVCGGGQYNSTAQVIFATYQIFSRDEHLEKFPLVNMLVIDEAHRAPTDSYQKVIQHLLKGNPDLMILGLTATPSRADKKLMSKTFPRITSVVKVQEAIDEGVLVKPIFKTMALKGAHADRILKAKLYALERDKNTMSKKKRYASLVDEQATNEAVVTHWKEQAGDRQTVVFCSTIDHGQHVTEAFEKAGVKVGLVHSQMPEPEKVLEAYSRGKIQVIVNVFKLTEGWDDPPTSCVVLLRPSSYVNTWRQMIGRGLRAFPKKENCTVLDFGISTLVHITTPEVTGLEEEEELQEEEEEEEERRRRKIGEDDEDDEDYESESLRLLRLVEAGEMVMKDVDSILPSMTNGDSSAATVSVKLGPTNRIMPTSSKSISFQASGPATPTTAGTATPTATAAARTPTATPTANSLSTDFLWKAINSEHIMHYLPSKRDGGDRWTPPAYTTRWSFPQCSDGSETMDFPPEESSNDGLAMPPSLAEHHVLHTYDVATSLGGIAIVTRPYVHNNDWVAVCGWKDSMAVTARGDKQNCLTAASKWWTEHWGHRNSLVAAMDKTYSKPSEKQLAILIRNEHLHQTDHPMFTKYKASVIIALLVDKYKVLDALDKNEREREVSIGSITRRPPWRRYED